MSKPLVVDASLVLRLIMPGSHQADVQSQTSRWLAAGYEMQAPSLWVYELTSVLCKAVHSPCLPGSSKLGRCSAAQSPG
jgi:hypothetical protein